MKHTHTFLILWISSIFFLTNCIKKEEVLGTQIVTAKAGFKMETLDYSSKRLNLIKDPLTIHVKFNQEITTIFKIISSSGATKKYQQTGREINQVWRGGHDGLQFFKAGDTCFVELSFYGIDEKIQDTLILEKAFNFKDKHMVDFTNDFESFGKWIQGDNKIGTLENKSIAPIQGKKYLTLEGTASSNSVYVGGLWLGDLDDNPMKLMSGNNISENPSDIWFNIYAYGTGDESSEVYFTMFEKDYAKKIESSGGITDDGIQVKITFEHQGWKLFSFKYSDIPFKTYNALTGNNKREPNLITILDIALQSTTQGGTAKAMIDFPIITQGGPFDPSKY